jgi:Activator of Hsp90 ATPase homolog 1-like protein
MTAEVSRSVEIDTDVATVWEAVADPAQRVLWLDDPEALARQVRVDEASPGERLVWTWWRPGDEGDASTVSVVLRPVDGGGTRVVVTETLPAVVPPTGTGPTVSASIAGRRSGRRVPAWVHCAGDRWDARLLGLELLFVAERVGAARVGVA